MRNVTDISTSKKLVKWMGKETEKQHYRRGKTHVITGTVWDEWSTETTRQHASTIGYPHETVPAYDFLDLIGRLKGSIQMEDCLHGELSECIWYKRCGNCCDLRIEKYDDKYVAGYICRENVFINLEENYDFKSLIECLADLVIFCGENNYLQREGG